jgi:hypothetical protein
MHVLVGFFLVNCRCNEPYSCVKEWVDKPPPILFIGIDQAVRIADEGSLSHPVNLLGIR